MAPPPPPHGKKQKLMSDSESQDPETLSLLVMFDELVRNEKVISFSYFMFLKLGGRGVVEVYLIENLNSFNEDFPNFPIAQAK